MSSEAIKESVIEHALEKKENLKVACLIRANFDEILLKVISQFLRRLQEQLRTSLGDGWIFDDRLRGDISNGEFRISKDTWDDRCAIVLSQEGERKGFYVGWHRYEGFGQSPEGFEERIMQALETEGYARGKVQDDASGWGIWWIVAERYSRWDQSNPETLAEMYFGDSAVNYFADQIRAWVAAVEPLVDRVIGNFS